jgi:hypothetical protein
MQQLPKQLYNAGSHHRGKVGFQNSYQKVWEDSNPTHPTKNGTNSQMLHE